MLYNFASSALGLGLLALPALSVAWTIYATVRSLNSLERVPHAKPLHASKSAPAIYPKISVIVPACNEAGTLLAATTSKLDADYPNLEVVIINDRSTDATGVIADQLAAADSRVRVVHIDHLPEGWLGKLHALFRGTEAATGEWLLFSDADVHIAPGFLGDVTALAEARQLDFVTVMPRFHSSSFMLDIMFAYFMRALVAGGRTWKMPDPTSHVAVGGGVFNLTRKSAYLRSPGFVELRMEVVDDTAFAQMLKASGARCAVFNGSESVSLYFYRSVRELMHGLEKNGYALLGRLQPLYLALGVFAVLYTELMPLFALLSASAWVRGAGLSLIVLTGIAQAFIARSSGRPLLSAFVPGIAPLLMVLFGLRSALITHRQGGIVWRGTAYPLDELRKGRRIRLP